MKNLIPQHSVQQLSEQLVAKSKSANPEERVEKGMAKALLLNGDFMYRGDMFVPVVKHLGLGVYSVSMKAKEYPKK